MNADDVVTDDRLKAAEHFIEEEEGAASRFGPRLELLITTLLVVMSLFHLYAAAAIVPTTVLRPVHVGFVLLLIFLIFPATKKLRNRLMWYDVLLGLLGVATIVYLLAGGDDFWDRSTFPDNWDVAFGIAFVVLVLEACRHRTSTARTRSPIRLATGRAARPPAPSRSMSRRSTMGRRRRIAASPVAKIRRSPVRSWVPMSTATR